MNRWLAVLAVLLGVASVVAGVAWIYPPAGLIVFGAFCLATLLLEVGDG